MAVERFTILSTHKPAQVVAKATARVQTRDAEWARDVIDAGLAALGETRSSLYGYGIERIEARGAQMIEPGVYTVYAHRD